MIMSDLSEINRKILHELREMAFSGGIGNRGSLSSKLGLIKNTVSSALTRMEAMGFVEKPTLPGEGWTLSKTGWSLFGENPPVQQPEPEPQPEPQPEPEPVQVNSVAADIMVAMEIELALEQYRARMGNGAIPARSARVYRELIAPLPTVLREALAPITAMVEAA